MGIISEVKCPRCDRHYSGLRSRCPYCGARRNQRGKRSSDGDNNMWKFVIGLLILLILIVAVIVLVVSSLSEKNENKPDDSETSGDVNMSEDGVTNLEGSDENSGENSGETSGENSGETSGENSGETSGETSGENSGDTPTVAVESFVITYQGSEIAYAGIDTDYEISMSRGDVLTLGYATTPSDATVAEGQAVWSSSDTNSVVVLQSGEITVVGEESATVTLTIGTLSKTVYIRVG